MGLLQNPPALLVGLFLLLGSATLSTAHPYARDDLHDNGYGYLMPRDCAQYCGYNNMYCCSAGSSCYTSNGIAGCSAGAGGGFAWYTTTWTLTETFTSTLSSWVPVQTASAGQDCIPEAGSGWIACGSICCASWQYCAVKNQCSANGPPPAGATYTTVISSMTTVITTQYSAPYRVTGTGSTVTETGTAGSATTTAAGNGTATAGTSGAALSPGAIAGIVIGALAGIVLLLLLCACCIMRGLWHTMLSLLGLGKKKERRTETVIEEERYSRHGSVHGGRDRHTGWFGGGGGRPSTVASRKEKKKSSGAGWLGLTAAAGTLLLLLGLRKDKKRKTQSKARSEISSSYWSDSYYTSPSSASSGGRTRRTERTQRTTRTTRVESRGPSRAPSRVPSRAPSRR